MIDLFTSKNPKQTLKKAILLHLNIRVKKIELYQLALTHKSKSQTPGVNNERLEYLGDAVLGLVVAEFLYKLYPKADEGFLTEMRSKMVSRTQLNQLALAMDISLLLTYNHLEKGLERSQIFGNTLEALVGAVYLDRGFDYTKEWLIGYVFKNFYQLEAIEKQNINSKNLLLQWAHNTDKKLDFDIIEQNEGIKKSFICHLKLDDTVILTTEATSKKKASEEAAMKALTILQIVH